MKQASPQERHLSRTTLPRAARGVALAAAAVALSVSATGCSAITSITNSITNPSPSAGSFSGPVVGSGKQVKTADGSYETIMLPADSPVYASMNKIHMSAKPSPGAPAFTPQDYDSSQKFAADFIATQFLDSTALETGAAGLKDWIDNTAGKWLGPEAQQAVAANKSEILLGTYEKMPAMIHDGKPRVKDATITITSSEPKMLYPGKPGVEYKIHFSVGYRVSDHEAAAFAGSKVSPGPLTAEQFIASKFAKDQLKDGTGENILRDTGDATVGIAKVSSGDWEVDALQSQYHEDISDFAQNAQ